MSRPTMTSPSFGNVFEDITEVLWAPSKVFERAQYRTYGKYMVVLAVIALVITVIVAKLCGPWLDATMDMQIQLMAAKGTPVPENAVASMRKFGSVGFYFSPIFVVVLAGFIGGLLLMLGGKIVQAPLAYSQGVLIATLAAIPRVLSLLAAGIMAVVSDAEKARSMYDLSLGPAKFLDPTKMSPVLMQLLTGLDLFNLWQLLLFGIGVSVVAKVSRSTGFIAGLVAWVIGTVVPLLPTLLTA